MRHHIPLFYNGFALVAMACAGVAFAGDEPTYHVGPIGSVIAPGELSGVADLNEDGDATGEIWFNGFRQAYVYTYEHGPVLLPLVGSHTNARAFGISDRDADGEVIIVGTATGGFFSEAGAPVAWRYSTTTGRLIETREIADLPGYVGGSLNAVNSAGIAVGRAGVPPEISVPMVYDVHADASAALDFPWTPMDINDAGQIVGGQYMGTIAGGDAVDVGAPPDTTGIALSAINEPGDVVGTVTMPYTDGAGHVVKGAARRIDGGWHLLWANSWLDNATDINDRGDVVGAIGFGGAVHPIVYLDGPGVGYLVNDQIAADEPFSMSSVGTINSSGQIGCFGLAAVLTPLGEMIIPGDVNGDAEVTPDDLCAWLAMPVDLDGDGEVDDADEAWLVARVESIGYDVQDCNGNDLYDVCDIADGTSDDCNGNGTPDECEADCDGNGVPDDCEPDCNANGEPDACDIAEGRSTDCNGNGVPDECDGSDTFGYAVEHDPPLFLPANTVYTEDLLVTGSGAIEDVDFTFDIDYRIGNLRVTLTHEDVTITLLDQPGVPETPQGNGQLGYRIVLDDEGTGGTIEDEGNFGSPFEPILSPPSYTPDMPLSNFDGLPVGGVWTVEITTVGFSPVSGLIGWGMVITDAAAAGCPTGDLNGDGAVDAADLASMLASWGVCTDCPADLDGDDIVGPSDLAILLANWTS